MKPGLSLGGWLLLYRNPEVETGLRVWSTSDWGSKWVDRSLTIMFVGTLTIVVGGLFIVGVLLAARGALLDRELLGFSVFSCNVVVSFDMLCA